MKNLTQMMKQAQEMQYKMKEIQQDLAATDVEGQACNGLVKVVLNGKFEVKSVYIEASLFTEEDKEVVEDLVVTAHNDAREKIEELTKERMAEVTGGLDLPPGMSLP